jgi:hypothetical protein
MTDVAKIRIAYTGSALDNGAMDVNDLAPALLAFGKFIQRANTVIGNQQPVKVMLKADDIRPGSFDISMQLVTTTVLEQAKLFMGMADNSGLSALMQIIGYGATAGTMIKGIYELINYLSDKKLTGAKQTDAGNIELTVENNISIVVSEQLYKVFCDHEARENIEKTVEPLKCDGIDGLEIRDPDNLNNKAPTVAVKKENVASFKAPELKIKVEPDNEFEQEMLLKIVGIVFDENQKWRFSDGDVSFWARIADESFWQQVNTGTVAFRSGDRLKVSCKTIQRTGPNESLITERTITKVIKVLPKPTQIQLDFEE